MHLRSTILVVAAAVCLAAAGCAPKAAPSARPTAQLAGNSTAQHDWRNATYRVTCDGLLAVAVTARLSDGAATVPVDIGQSQYYDDVELHVQATATGDVDGSGKPETVVLLSCAPQPSNATVQEVHVFRPDGSQLAVLPSANTLPQATILAPVYLPEGLAVENGDVVAAMKAYGPGDSHATGPSVPITVRWHWTGSGFAPEV